MGQNTGRSDVLHPIGDNRSPFTEEIKLLHPDPAEFHIINGDNDASAPYFTISNGGMNTETISAFDRMMKRESDESLWKSLTTGCLFVLFFPLFFFIFSIKIISWLLSIKIIIYLIISWLLILSLIPCVYLMFQKHLLVKKAQKLHGTVVGYREREDTGGDCERMYALIVEYGDHGVKSKIISKASCSSTRYMKKIGDLVIVLSYPDSTEKELFEERYIVYYVWICIGIAAICFLFLYEFYL